MSAFLLTIMLGNLSLAYGQSAPRVKDNFKSMTVIENPFELRDPFRAPISTNKEKEARAQKSLMRDGIYTNIDVVEVKDISELRIVGVMIGRERRALAKIGAAGKDIIILKEGMRIGSDKAELKAIHPGGVILVEKLVNVYGEEEFLETVIPISQ